MLSDHFNLTHSPFSDESDLTGLFSCPDFEDTYDELLLGVLDGRRLQLVVGNPGSGRSTMLARVRIGLEPTEFDVITVRYADCTMDEFCRLLAADVEALDRRSGAAGSEHEQADPQQRLLDALETRRRDGRPVVFLLDDAERLGGSVLNPLPELLGPSRDEPLAQAVMAVPPDFVQRLTGIELDQLNAAIDGIMHLAPWDETTTTDYICACVQSCAGVAGQIFAEDAFTEVAERSGGMPARVNALCAGALQIAFEQGKRRVERSHVQAAFDAIDQGDIERIRGERAHEALERDDGLEADEPPRFAADPSQRPLGRRLTGLLEWLGSFVKPLAGFARRAWARLEAWFSTREQRVGTPTRTMVAGASVLVVATITGVIFLLNPLGAREKPARVVTAHPTKALTASSAEASGEFKTAVQPVAFSERTAPAAVPSAAIAVERSARTVTDPSAAERRREEHLQRLTEAVQSLSRTLVSVEARMRGFESEIAELQTTVHRLDAGPRVLQASRSGEATSAPRPAKMATIIPAKAEPQAQNKVVSTNASPRPVEVMAGARDSVHVVRKGDTLWGIAKRYGTTVTKLSDANQLNPRAALRQGQRIRIGANPAANQWYVVRKGDSLYSIGKRFAVTPAHLRAWNCLRERKSIFPGQKLSLQAPSSGACSTGQG